MSAPVIFAAMLLPAGAPLASDPSLAISSALAAETEIVGQQSTAGPVVYPSESPAALFPSLDDPVFRIRARDDDGADRDDVAGPRPSYGFSNFTHDISEAGWEVAGATAFLIVPRIRRRIRSSVGFDFRSEGLFGRDTKTLGMDKLMHSFEAYLLTDILQAAIAYRVEDDRSATITSGILAAGISTLAETLDGFSPTGFSHEDALVNLAGVGFSVVRNLNPGLHDLVDFRLSLRPAFDGSLSVTDRRLDRSRYLLAFQLAGIERFERTPLRFVEVQGSLRAVAPASLCWSGLQCAGAVLAPPCTPHRTDSTRRVRLHSGAVSGGRSVAGSPATFCDNFRCV